LIDESHRAARLRGVVAERVGCLVDQRVHHERELRLFARDTLARLRRDATIQIDPAGEGSEEMCVGGAPEKPGAARDVLAPRQSSLDEAERSNPAAGKLEERR